VVKITYIIEDSDGERYAIVVYSLFAFGSTTEDIRTVIVEPFWALIFPLITGILVDMYFSVSLKWAVGTVPNNVVDVLSDIQEQVRFKWSLGAHRDLEMQLTLPTIREVILTNSGAGKVVDLTDTDVQAFLAQMANMSYAGLWPVDKHSSTLYALKSAVQHFGK